MSTRQAHDLIARIQSRITVDANGCHVFQGCLSIGGYGQISSAGRKGYTHRLMYEATNGPIPRGLHVDHLCRNRACCNPAHLEAVTQAENNRRAAAANRTRTTGVYHTPNASSSNPWMASISVDGRMVHLGLFPTQEAAVNARKDTELAYATSDAIQGGAA